MKVKHRLAVRRDAKDLTQDQVAAILKTCQSEVAKVEAGEKLPPEKRMRAWAKVYGVSVKTLKAESQMESWEPLQLWKMAVSSPREIEHIKCVSAVTVGQERERQHQQRMEAEYVEHYRQEAREA